MASLEGEWFLRASIMQCEDAILGRIHFMDSGELVYLTTAGDLLGRGIGRWLQEGRLVGFELDIFQYEATSKKHVQAEPHRFRGFSKCPENGKVWVGEWQYLPFQQPPRLVGRFHASQSMLKVPSLSSKPLEDLPKKLKENLAMKLEKLSQTFPMMEPSWVPHHLAGKIQDVHYVRNFLEPKQVEEFERIIDRTCDWEKMQTRDTQEFGSSGTCPCGRSLLRAALPPWQSTMVDALGSLGAFHPVLFPANSVRLNAYKPGQGIHPHLDGPVYFPRAAIVSLGSHCIFDFYPRMGEPEEHGFSWDRDKEVPSSPQMPPGTKPQLSLLLEPGSLLVLSGDAFTYHRHGIKAVEEDEITAEVKNAKDIGLSVGDSLRRTRRISLTIRHLLPRCNCSPVF
ncbi:Alpha-ketoglutarate-dependent dioxygenase alkB homolog 6 (Alkylated DNA repair protein alkB homolog 6) [Durusdinium trenchii]|uniref:Alpha-ketoglutarate-dependent dioxygenase alkB homolog 6 (Alkylated DNA repair protein alkB homolog 6) n=2 Tax=Durusdinium trenchii TaxID=1381693 RepID=A0ABP0LF33_9DINO